MAVTMGDASGVGPEIVLRRVADGGFADELSSCTATPAILATAPYCSASTSSSKRRRSTAWRPGRSTVVDAGLLQAADHRPGRDRRGVRRGGPRSTS